MKTFIIGVGFLFAFIETGNSLVCEECTHNNSTDCHGEQKTCGPEVLTCETSIMEIVSADKPVVYLAIKDCSEQLCEDLFYSVSTVGLNSRMKRVCCTSDGCNAGAMELPPRDHSPNEAKCPMCLHEHALECESIGTLSCTGEETSCISFGGHVETTGGQEATSVMAYQGCVNMETCDPFPRFPEGVIPAIHHAKCTKGSGARRSADTP